MRARGWAQRRGGGCGWEDERQQLKDEAHDDDNCDDGDRRARDMSKLLGRIERGRKSRRAKVKFLSEVEGAL